MVVDGTVKEKYRQGFTEDGKSSSGDARHQENEERNRGIRQMREADVSIGCRHPGC
jgi:hypothetical protein